MDGVTPELHATQNRGLRELYATTRQLVNHWSTLSSRLPAGAATDALDDGVDRGRALLDELRPLTESFGLYGFPAAQGVGVSLAVARSRVGDRFLERNQALRIAVLDVQHVVTLLGYLAQVARTLGQQELLDFCTRWERELLAVERAARRAAVKGGADPDDAVERADESAAGKAAHGASYAIGSVGEWLDRARRGR
jgi:hypothetical protein